MCSSEEFGQEHARLLVVRVQGAVAGGTLHMGTQCAGYQGAISKANASIRSGVKEVILDWQSSYTFQNKRSEAGSIINRKSELVKSATLQASKYSQD
jgi:hypothetical protein